MNWSSKKVLVTGAGGFIGSHLAERLAGMGADVRALVRYNSAGSRGWLDKSETGGGMEVVAGDVCDRDCVRKIMESVDIVFHLAALIGIPYSYHAPASYVRTNVEGTLNILQAALEAKTERIVHTSTSEVYGTARYVDSLRPSRLRTWDSYFLDRPFLGGEVSSLAGFIGVTLATIGDGRTSWGTPWDTVERIDKVYIEDQLALLTDMLEGVSVAQALHSGIFPRMGYSSVSGTSNLLLHGELFANYPTADTVLLSYQGIAKLYGWVNRDGTFLFKEDGDN